ALPARRGLRRGPTSIAGHPGHNAPLTAHFYHHWRIAYQGGRPMDRASPADIEGQFWAVVLAGGEGVRLRPLIRRLYGETIPNQFPALGGSRSLLRQALDRVQLAVQSDRTVVVTLKSHDCYLREGLDGAPVRHVLEQPEDKDTAAGVLFPVHWIHRHDPEAIVAVFPSDHFVKEEQPFMEHVADMADVIREHPE